MLPPLWARWWAFAIYAAIIFYILQRYIAYKQRKQRLEHELYLKQIEKDKSEEFNRELQTFFTQVAHEFRTPLTLILNPLDNRPFQQGFQQRNCRQRIFSLVTFIAANGESKQAGLHTHSLL